MKKAILISACIFLLISCKDAAKNTNADDHGGIIVAVNTTDSYFSKFKPALRKINYDNDSIALDSIIVP